MSALYNEIEPYAAAWLGHLSDAGHIARGGVDVRSIRELRATDVVGATQFHAFAGLGAWSYALRLAGWPDDRPVWTGSCPCQPFSSAGAGLGFDDERHLWPEWFRLIRECRPSVLFGEQVASGAGLAWLDVVRADLEGEGYAVGAADLCAASVGAPHIRQRLFFGAVRVADAGDTGCGVQWRGGVLDGERPALGHDADGRGAVRGVADARREGRREVGALAEGGRARGAAEGLGERPMHGGDGDVADAGRPRLPARERDDLRGEGRREEGGEPGKHGVFDGGVADPPGERREGQRLQPAHGVPGSRSAAAPWEPVEWLPCRDGKARPTQPGLFPLAHGAAARVGRLRAYGNAIVPQVAAGFVRAFMEATS